MVTFAGSFLSFELPTVVADSFSLFFFLFFDSLLL